MAEIIDVHDLPDEHVKLIEEFVEFLRGKGKRRGKKAKKEEDVAFASWPLKVKGELRRSEIYDYL